MHFSVTLVAVKHMATLRSCIEPDKHGSCRVCCCILTVMICCGTGAYIQMQILPGSPAHAEDFLGVCHALGVLSKSTTGMTIITGPLQRLFDVTASHSLCRCWHFNAGPKSETHLS